MTQLLGTVASGPKPLAERFRTGAWDFATERAALNAPAALHDGGVVVALVGRPRIEGATADATPASLHEAYRADGVGMLARLRGDFALAIVDLGADRALLAIDRMGIQSLAWCHADSALIFGSSAAAVARSRSGRPELNRQTLFDFMLGHMVPAPDTAFAGVAKLNAGTYLTLERGALAIRRYWHPDFARASGAELAALAREVQAVIGRAIARCAPGERTGTFLSGGLDSSTVTGMFSKSRSAPVHAFSVAFGVEEFNELSYARLASERFGCEHHVYEVTPADIVELVPRIAAAYDEPFGNSSAVPTFCCARMARSAGFEHLLAGDGGDEIFGGNARYVRQQVFEHYARVPAVLRKLLVDPVADLFDPESSPLPFRKLSSYVRQARVPLPERLESWNMIYREGASTVFDPEFLAGVDASYPLRKMHEFWDECPSRDLLDRMLWFDWKVTLADNDLRKVSRMCELAGVRVSYPMIDEELVDLSLRIPSAAKIANGELRTFFKRAVADLLPAEIIRKKKHGFGLPFGQWLKTDARLKELVFGSLDSLRRRDILNRAFVQRVLDEHGSGHAGYYGYAIWDMLMLEQWLQSQSLTT
jgi:asparagine synthase (glutamine-hydrolysing)